MTLRPDSGAEKTQDPLPRPDSTRGLQLQTLILRIAVVPFVATMVLTLGGAYWSIVRQEFSLGAALLLLPLAWAVSLWWGGRAIFYLRQADSEAAVIPEAPPTATPESALADISHAQQQLLLALSTECVRSQELHVVAQALIHSVGSFFSAQAVCLGLSESGPNAGVHIEAATSPQLLQVQEVGLEAFHKLIWRQGASCIYLEGEQIQEAFPGRFSGQTWNRYYCIPLGIREPLRRGLGDAPVATLGPRNYVLDGVLEVFYGPPGVTGRLTEGKLEFLQIVGNVIEIAVSNWKLYRRLELEKNFIEIVLEGMADGVLTLDARGKVATCNDAAARLLGQTRTELIGSSLDHVLPLSRGSLGHSPNEPEGWSHLVSEGGAEGEASAAKGSSLQDFSLSISLPGLGLRTLALQVSRKRSQVGAIGPSAVIVFRDISKQRELEELRSDFTATLSHELRTPLTGMKGYLQMLMHRKARDFGPDKVQGIVAIINHQADQLHRLILDLLEAAKLKSQALEIYPHPTDIIPHIKKLSAEGKQATQSLSLDLPDNCWVLCDAEKIQSVLTHLISNALKYSVPGGTVAVRCTTDSRFAILSIQDEGVGIPLDQQDKIFDMYHRVETGNTRTHYGVGLGLYIARKVVEAHGGAISVTSTPGCGATFSFTLPLIAPPGRETE